MYEFSIELQYHGQDHGYMVYAAANVKYPYGAKLPKKYDEWLERLRSKNSKKAEQLEQWAWENTAEWYWEQVKEEADNLGLCKVYSVGRSGGWLVLDDYTRERVAQLVESINDYRCVCGLHFMDHFTGSASSGHSISCTTTASALRTKSWGTYRRSTRYSSSLLIKKPGSRSTQAQRTSMS